MSSIEVGGRFHNTVQAENFFNHSSVIRKKIATWHNAIPGILTGLGLFGTFVALLLGLAQLHVEPDTEKVTGISEFINALSGKFSSSIAGLLMAILYTSCERILVSKLDNYLYHLQHRINEIFTRITPEKLLSLSLNESKKQSASMELLASDLAERIQASMQQSINPEINKMIVAIEQLNKTTDNLGDLNTQSLNRAIDALDGIKSQSSDAIVEAMKSMMEEFRSTLTGTASNELGELSKSLANASSFLASMDTKNQQMEDRMGLILNQLSEGLANQQNQFGSHSQALAQTMENLIAKMEQSSSQSVEVLQGRIEEMLQQNTGWATQMQEQMQGMAQSLTQVSERMIVKVQEASTSQSNQLQETQNALNAQQREMVQGLQQEMSTLVENIGQQIQEREIKIQELFNQAVQSQQQLIGQITNASSELKRAFEQYKDTLEVNKVMLAEAKPVVSQLQGVSGQIGSGLERISESNSQMQRTLNENQQFVQSYQQLVADLKSLHDRQKDAYTIMDERLGSILKQINDHMIQYNATTRDGLQKVLGDWDNELRTSVKLLSGPVSELGESFELLTEMLDKKLQRS